MTKFPDLITTICQNSQFKHDVRIEASSVQSDARVAGINIGHRQSGQTTISNGERIWDGVWVSINHQLVWLTPDEARAMALALVQSAGRMERGEPG